MAIKMVREPSETPNINNIDDIVPMRYAYGNQNGYVIGKGNEISNTINGLNFTVNSGRLVLQGVECDIDASGVTITIDNIATKRYYTVYLEVNLGLDTATIKSKYDTATYPTIDVGDDLTENTTGVARLPLYRFTATSGIISEVNKVVESVKYLREFMIKNNAGNIVFNGKGSSNRIKFESLNELADFLNNFNFETGEIISLKFDSKKDIITPCKLTTIRPSGISVSDTPQKIYEGSSVFFKFYRAYLGFVSFQSLSGIEFLKNNSNLFSIKYVQHINVKSDGEVGIYGSVYQSIDDNYITNISLTYLKVQVEDI